VNRKKIFNTIEDKAICWLAKINSSTFNEQQQREFFIWLEASPLHQAAYIKAEDLWQRGEVLARLPTAGKAFQFNVWQGWSLAVASFAAIFLLFSLYMGKGTTHYEFQTAIGEQKDVQLADGTHLALNTNTKVAVKLDSRSRVVTLLRGEVFFDVARDPSKPFDVITEVGVVRVLGTHFAVRQTIADAIVTVVEGKVSLGQISSLQEYKPVAVLTANEQLNFQAANSGAAPEKINATSLLSWRNKQLVYKGQQLSEVIVDLNRYFPIAITLSDVAIGQREVTAVIKLTDIKTTIQALCSSLGLQAEFNADATKVTLTPRTSAIEQN